MSIGISGRQVRGFLWAFRRRDRSHWEGKLNTKGKLNLHVICRERAHVRHVLPTDMVGLHWIALQSIKIKYSWKGVVRFYINTRGGFAKNKCSWERMMDSKGPLDLTSGWRILCSANFLLGCQQRVLGRDEHCYYPGAWSTQRRSKVIIC